MFCAPIWLPAETRENKVGGWGAWNTLPQEHKSHSLGLARSEHFVCVALCKKQVEATDGTWLNQAWDGSCFSHLGQTLLALHMPLHTRSARSTKKKRHNQAQQAQKKKRKTKQTRKYPTHQFSGLQGYVSTRTCLQQG